MSAKSVAVIGAGTMGGGIAQVAAAAGWSVWLDDADGAAVTRALDGLRRNVDRQVQTGKMAPDAGEALLRRIQPLTEGSRPDDLALVIEAVFEDLPLKQRILRTWGERSADALLATNTSSLSVSRIAEPVADPRRVVGMHFFNPAPMMPLVEIIAARRSDTARVAAARDIVQGWGKVAVLAKDTPGFIVNRVARGFYLEALRLLDEGVGGIDEIDAVLRTHGGFKMGPFQLMDLVGLDVNLAVSTSVWEQLNRPARLRPHPIQQGLVEQGRLGRKTQRGFYVYDEKGGVPAFTAARKSFEVSPLLSDALRAFCERGGMERASRTEQYILARILGAIMNEAAFALGEQVATAEHIDLAMIKGTNYPQGPLAWIDRIGTRTVRGVLAAFNGTVGDNRYEPAALFV